MSIECLDFFSVFENNINAESEAILITLYTYRWCPESPMVYSRRQQFRIRLYATLRPYCNVSPEKNL